MTLRQTAKGTTLCGQPEFLLKACLQNIAYYTNADTLIFFQVQDLNTVSSPVQGLWAGLKYYTQTKGLGGHYTHSYSGKYEQVNSSYSNTVGTSIRIPGQ